MPDPIEWEITEEQLANYPSYGWPLRCCFCGSGVGARVTAPEIHRISFQCQMCGKWNRTIRSGTRIRVSPARLPIGWAILILAVALVLVTQCPAPGG